MFFSDFDDPQSLQFLEKSPRFAIAEQCGALKTARDAIRRLQERGGLRDLVLRERKDKGMNVVRPTSVPRNAVAVTYS